jgi:hypothetical protein
MRKTRGAENMGGRDREREQNKKERRSRRNAMQNNKKAKGTMNSEE